MRLIDKSLTESIYSSLKDNLEESIEKDKKVINESARVIWTSEYNLDDYNDEDGNSPEPEQVEELELEDLNDNVIPELDSKINEYLILKGSNQTWQGTGTGWQVFSDAKELLTDDTYDDVKLYTDDSDNTYFSGIHHDGGTTGMLMTFSKSEDEVEKFIQNYLDDEEFSMYYFKDYVDADILQKLDEAGYLKPITGLFMEDSVNEGVMINTGTTNITSDETGVTIEDNGNTITSGNGVTIDIDNESDVSIDSEEAPVEDSEEDYIEPADDLDENAIIEFNHIDDVWNELEKCKSIEDMEKLIKNIPNKFGSFDIELSDDGKTAKVTNTYEENGEYNEDVVDISLEDNLNESTTEDEFGTKELARQAFVSLQKDEDKDGHVEYIIMKDGRAIERLNASSDDEAISLFNEKYQKLQDDGLNEAEQTIDIFANPEFDYKITDITTLQPTDAGDVRAIDMDDILVGLDESLTERYGNPDYIKLNSFLTKKGKDYSSAIVDVSWPNCKGYVCTFESSCVDGIYNCIIKETATNKRIEHLCVKTTNPIKAFENAIVDLVNMKKQSLISEHDSILEDVELIHNDSHVEDNNGVTYTDDTRVEDNADRTNKLIKDRKKLLNRKNKDDEEPNQKNTSGEKVADIQDKITESDSDLVNKLKNLRDEAADKSRSIDEITRDLINYCSDSGQEDLVYGFGIIPTEEAKENIMSSVSNSDFDNLKSIINGIEDSDSEYLLIDGYGRYRNISYDKLESIIEDIINGVSLNEAVEDDSNISSNIEDEDNNITDDNSLEEDTLSKAKFHRKPSSVEQMMTEEKNNLVTNSSSYTVVATKELSDKEFEDFSNNLSSSYPWLKELYNVEDSSGVFNCIEVTGGKDYSILVDPSGYDYARYAAINGTPEEVSDESNLENNEVVEDNE